MSESRWSPEDYEAGKALLAFIRANRSWFCGGRMMEPYESQAAEKLSAYLSRVSPSCVDSVAVEDVERLQAAVDKAYGAMNSSAYVGGPSEREAWQTALAALGEVVTQHTAQADPESSRSSTDRPEQPEPDVLGGQPPAEPETTGGASDA
jgi:hypothetical protein